MKLIFLVIGKTEDHYLRDGIAVFEKRLLHYIPFEMKEIPAVKKSSGPEDQKRKETELILKHPDIVSCDMLVLLDEKGAEFTSLDFAGYLQKQLNKGKKKLVFLAGGPYGFSEEISKKSTDALSLSRMTFSHQMVRLFFVEQVYRAMTILKREKYHH